MSNDLVIRSIHVVPVRLPLREPFVISYATYPDVLSILVRVTVESGLVGWGEATPDPNVTGETWSGTAATLRDELAPVMIGHDARHRESALLKMDAKVEGVPSAKAAIDIALHDLIGKAVGVPVWMLLGGKARQHLTISRVVSMKSPAEMASDAVRHVENGFHTIKVKVGQPDNPMLDSDRILAVRQAIGPTIGLKVDVNQGWRTAGMALAAIRASLAAAPDYYEQPVAMADLEGLAEVRRQTGAIIMADEACHGSQDMLRIANLRAADLVNIKLMKCGGLFRALQLNAIAETAGIRAQVGTMVESSIASAAGLHLALAVSNIRTVEMGGPLMLREDVGTVKSWNDRDQITVPDSPGLGIEVDEERVRRFSQGWYTVR